ncbi:MAG TPA: sigma-70 family RNA polymerase sigma factor [Phycisphaerae bacterium]|nr:sigma-70 family RNA polymerase sigma factor [Phycisphaerae bacterium]
MAEPNELEISRAIPNGAERSFEQAHDLFHARVRLMAFRISHRPDWIDDLENEAWCRAFRQRTHYEPATPFLVWMAGILRNVYREFCRDSHLTVGGGGMPTSEKIDLISPEKVAHESEVLGALNECVGALPEADARIVRLRFFENLPLRSVAQEVGVPEATLREKTLVKLINQLRACLQRKNIDFSEIFSAQGRDEMQ